MHGQNHIEFVDKFSHKSQTSNLTEILPVTVALMHADRRTDMTEGNRRFSDYVNASKMSTFKPNMRYHNNKKTHFVNMVTVVVQQFKNTEPMNHCHIKMKIILCEVHNNT